MVPEVIDAMPSCVVQVRHTSPGSQVVQYTGKSCITSQASHTLSYGVYITCYSVIYHMSDRSRFTCQINHTSLDVLVMLHFFTGLFVTDI